MKKLYTIGLMLSALFVLTGCGNKVATTALMPVQYKKSEPVVQHIFVDMRDGRSLLRSRDAQDSALAALERAANLTLENGYTHFAIWSPIVISNYRGSTINTLAEFQKDCLASGLGAVVTMVDAFGISDRACHMAFGNNPNQAGLDFIMLNAPSDEILTWDAKKLIEDLKKEYGLVSGGEEWEVIPNTPKPGFFGRPSTMTYVEFKWTRLRYWHKMAIRE